MDEEDFSRRDFGFLLISFKKLFFQNLSCCFQGAAVFTVDAHHLKGVKGLTPLKFN